MHHLHHRVRETLILDSYLLVGLPNKTQAVGDGSTFIHLPHIDNGNTLSITLYLANVAKLGLTKEANLAINNPTDNNHITPLSRSTFNLGGRGGGRMGGMGAGMPLAAGLLGGGALGLMAGEVFDHDHNTYVENNYYDDNGGNFGNNDFGNNDFGGGDFGGGDFGGGGDFF
jgi:hypothetical protein